MDTDCCGSIRIHLLHPINDHLRRGAVLRNLNLILRHLLKIFFDPAQAGIQRLLKLGGFFPGHFQRDCFFITFSFAST
jgi:hypothetical protein